jgi:ABC-type uncharacterized transport system permease subunit
MTEDEKQIVSSPTAQEEFKYLNDEIAREQEYFWTRFSGFATLHAGLLVLVTSNATKSPRFLSGCAIVLGIVWFYVQWASRFYVNRDKKRFHVVREKCGYPYVAHPTYSRPFLSPTDIAVVVPIMLMVVWLYVFCSP